MLNGSVEGALQDHIWVFEGLGCGVFGVVVGGVGLGFESTFAMRWGIWGVRRGQGWGVWCE